MSYPTEFDAILVKIGDGAATPIYTIICGIENATLNETVNTSDRFRRDCEKPGQVPSRKVTATSKQWDMTGSGVSNADQITLLKAALGIRRPYQLVGIKRDGTDTGQQIGTFYGSGVLTARNFSFGEESTMEVTIAGEDELTWTPAPV